MSLYYKVPISYYHLYLKKGSREGKEFAKKKLRLYINWKRRLVLFLLNLSLLPRKRINSKADIIFIGSRKKEIYFDKKRIITYGNCKKDYETRVKMNKHFNCTRNPKYSKEKLEEDLIWPTEEIKDEDVVEIFEKLMIYYKENFKKESEEKIIKEKEKRWKTTLNINNSSKKFISTKVHGDFWKGNLEKDLEGKIWIFDWGQTGRGTVLEDFYNYFLIEYLYTKKINHKLLKKIKKNFEKENIDLENHFDLENRINKNLRKNFDKKLDSFRRIILKEII